MSQSAAVLIAGLELGHNAHDPPGDECPCNFLTPPACCAHFKLNFHSISLLRFFFEVMLLCVVYVLLWADFLLQCTCASNWQLPLSISIDKLFDYTYIRLTATDCTGLQEARDHSLFTHSTFTIFSYTCTWPPYTSSGMKMKTIWEFRKPTGLWD